MTKASFIDEKKVLVETPQGVDLIIGFQSNIHYQLETRHNIQFLKFLETVFDIYYHGNDNDVFGSITVELIRNGFESVFSCQRAQKDYDRIRIGARIKELREKKGVDSKTLAYYAGIDAANLCRIEAGKYSAGFDVLTKIAGALGMKVDFVELNSDEDGGESD